MAKKVNKPISEDQAEGPKPIFLNGDKLYMNRIYNRLFDEKEVTIMRPLVPKNGIIEELLGNLCRINSAEISIGPIKSKVVEKTNKKGDKKFNVTYNDLIIKVKLVNGSTEDN